MSRDRHCERSEAIHTFFARRAGLLRSTRNDGSTPESSWLFEIRAPSLRGAKRRGNPFFLCALSWIALLAMTVITSKRRIAAINHKTIGGVIGRCLAHQIHRDAAEIRGLAEPPQ